MDNSISLADLISVADKLSVVGLMVLLLYGLMKQWWVPGWQYREALQEKDRQIQEVGEDRDEFKNLVWRLANISERAAAGSERATTVASQTIGGGSGKRE